MPFFSFAQEQGNPFEKANEIIVYHKMDIETAFDEMYNLLVDNGYLVIEANERFHFLATEEVKKKGPYWLSIHCRVDKDKILLSGTSSGRKATYRPSITASDRIAFDNLDEIAKKIPTKGIITYSIL
jgi:hypothetical protein